MATSERVCPFCGEPPGPGMFCAACGRNLGGVDRLPTREEWQSGPPGEAGPEPDPQVMEERCAAAVADFLAAMRAAGEPGRAPMDVAIRKTFGRTPRVEGWTIRPVHREDDASTRGYRPGLFLTAGGAFHRLDNEVRGWGQRDFPRYHHEVAPEPVPMPVDARLVPDLAAVLEANGVTSEFGRGAERC